MCFQSLANSVKGDQLSIDVTGMNVLLLDFAFDKQTILKMIKAAKSLLVLDHHQSNQVELASIPNTFFDMNRSASKLSWHFFHPGKPPPQFLDYIEDKGTWGFCRSSDSIRSVDMEA